MPARSKNPSSAHATARTTALASLVAGLALAAVPMTATASKAGGPEGDFARMQSSIGGATIDSNLEIGGPEQVTFFNGDAGQAITSNSQFTVVANGASLSKVEYGRMYLQPFINLDYFVEQGSSQNQVWGASHNAGGEFADTLTFTWAEGFDASQPIPVTVHRLITVPSDVAISTSLFSTLMINGNFRATTEAGFISGDASIVMGYAADRNNLPTVPRAASGEVVIANGGRIELYANVLNRADTAVRWNAGNPELNVPSGRSGMPMWASMWIDVPEGVVVSNLSVNDWTVRLLAPNCQADLDGDGTIGFSDVLVVLSNFGSDFLGDANADGMTDFQDVLRVLSLYGTVCTEG
ncbi:MAG: hypothetical protein AB8G96_00155 [Phycisphaerales bacterium]